uniref:Ovule protein n=1 Tax=Caenorhabditis tropicalis TaxID=1561998 RepID=A0A1I7U4X7_9PELO
MRRDKVTYYDCVEEEEEKNYRNSLYLEKKECRVFNIMIRHTTSNNHRIALPKTLIGPPQLRMSKTSGGSRVEEEDGFYQLAVEENPKILYF